MLNDIPVCVFIALYTGCYMCVERFRVLHAKPKGAVRGWRKRQKTFLKILAFLGGIGIILGAMSVTNYFYVTQEGIIYPSFIGHPAMEPWAQVQSVTLDCSSISRGRYAPTAYVPGYIVHFRDGKETDMWFGAVMGHVLDESNSGMYDFPAHYHQLETLLPPHTPITLGSGIHRCIQKMHALNSVDINAAIGSVPLPCKRNPSCDR
jgi:hypothetical protein